MSRNASLPHHAANRVQRDRCVHQLPEEHRLAAGQVSPAGNSGAQRGRSAVGKVWNGEQREAAKSCRANGDSTRDDLHRAQANSQPCHRHLGTD